MHYSNSIVFEWYHSNCSLVSDPVDTDSTVYVHVHHGVYAHRKASNKMYRGCARLKFYTSCSGYALYIPLTSYDGNCNSA